MKRPLVVAILGLWATIYMGCIDNFETKETGGKLYRLNKRTGGIDLVDGKSLIRLQNATPQGQSGLPPDEAARIGEIQRKMAEGTLHRTPTDEKTIAKYRKTGSTAPIVDKNDEIEESFPLQCRLPIGTQVDGWFYNGGNESDKSNWIPDTILTDKQIEAQPWKLFNRPYRKRWTNNADTITSY